MKNNKRNLQIIVLAPFSTSLLNKDSLPEPLNETNDKGTFLTNEEILRMAKDSNLLCTINRELDEKTQQLLSNIRQSRKVFKIDTRYTKRYYIMPSNIQTISEHRMKRLNKLDPVGDITASSEVLNKIDQAIIKRFAK